MDADPLLHLDQPDAPATGPAATEEALADASGPSSAAPAPAAGDGAALGLEAGSGSPNAASGPKDAPKADASGRSTKEKGRFAVLRDRFSPRKAQPTASEKSAGGALGDTQSDGEDGIGKAQNGGSADGEGGKGGNGGGNDASQTPAGGGGSQIKSPAPETITGASYRCPVCNRLTQDDKCLSCDTENHDWLEMSSLDHVFHFPLAIWVLVVGAFVLQVRDFRGSQLPPTVPFSFAIQAVGLVSLLASVVVVIVVVVFRLSLRKHELMRQAKRKHRGPSLVALGILCFAGFLIIFAGISLLSFTARDYLVSGSWRLLVQGLNGSSRTAFAPEKAQVSQPQWSPEGDRLLFSSNRDDDWEIFVHELESGKNQQLTNNTVQDMTPSWLADGMIVFASDRTGEWAWYTMDATVGESTAKPLTDWRQTASLSWSLDGKRFAFTEPGRNLFFAGEKLSVLEEKHPLIRSIVVSVMYPLLILSLMLFGAAGYVKSLEDKTHRPIYLNDRTMVKLAFDSFLEEMRTRLRGQDQPQPSNAQAHVHSQPSNAQADVHSFQRTDSGGLEIVVSYKVEVQEKDDKGRMGTATKEVFYQVKTNEWAEVRSIQKLDPRRMVIRTD